MRVTLDESRLAAYGVTPGQVYTALIGANRRLPAGSYAVENREVRFETGAFLSSAAEVGQVVVAVANERPVYVRDVATIVDGGEEPTQYVAFGQGGSFRPAVTLAVAKRKGANAIAVASAVLARVEAAKGTLIPDDVEIHITRQYGETAAEKSNELLLHMAIAVVSVSLLIALALGVRESLIVFAAIPVTLALTLTVFYLYGYSLNRITLFALIFSIGILVDDAIVVVENIARHARLKENKGLPLWELAVRAVDEVGNPTILATLTVIAAILPMAFVSGFVGPYMRPIPVGATAAMVFSLIVAFVVTPWAAIRLLKRTGREHEQASEDRLTRWYRVAMGALLARPVRRWGFLGLVAALLIGSMALLGIGFVKVKMLPFDNKSEFQLILDMPNGTPLEETARVAKTLAAAVMEQPEVVHVQTYAGVAAPFNFNGLVRHYYLPTVAHVADIQVNLQPKQERQKQSHEISKEVRARILPVAQRFGARVKVAEVPPGPPVLQTLVAEFYGPEEAGRLQIARQIREIFRTTEGVVDVDWYVEDDQPKRQWRVDREKAALHGLSEEDVARTLRMATAGEPVGLLHVGSAKEEVPIRLRLDRWSRSDPSQLGSLKVAAAGRPPVALRELIETADVIEDRGIYHKNLMPVTYLTAIVYYMVNRERTIAPQAEVTASAEAPA